MCQQHVDFVTVGLLHMREHGFELMEPELEALRRHAIRCFWFRSVSRHDSPRME
jgi:hypothetical protein